MFYKYINYYLTICCRETSRRGRPAFVAGGNSLDRDANILQIYGARLFSLFINSMATRENPNI
jgi:hypothetical protein